MLIQLEIQLNVYKFIFLNILSQKQIKIETTIIVFTIIVDSILDYAEDNDIDLIVIGTRGRSGIKKLLLGSTASGVVIYISCPVTVFK
jgi:nucleotide-binding universal stress UspA family protein